MPQPTSALILIGNSIAELKSKHNQAEKNQDSFLTELEKSHTPALDEMARRGCAGELLLEEEEEEEEAEAEAEGNQEESKGTGDESEQKGLKDRILQLLGIRLRRGTGLTLEGSKTFLQDRYRGARFAMLSNSDQVISLARSLGFATAVHYPSLQSAQESILSRAKELLGGTGQPQEAEFVLCCFVKGAQESASASLQLLGELARCFDTAESPVLRVAVVSYGHMVGAKRADVEAAFPRGEAEVHGFRLPKQSHETFERQDIKAQRVPMYAVYHHDGTTRRDNVSRFTEAECQRGANAKILAYHFLSEIGFLLGRRPKYGA